MVAIVCESLDKLLWKGQLNIEMFGWHSLGEMGGVHGIVDMNTSSFDEIYKHQY
jgi:hypothetical protein